MKKIYLPVIAFLFLISFANAQSGNRIALSFGPDLGIPFNTTSNTYGLVRDYYQDGLGASVKAEVPVSLSLHFTGSAGFVYYHTNSHYLVLPLPLGGSNASVQPPPYKFIPLKAGLQYYYAKYFYISVEAGAAIKGNSASLNSFIYSGGLGAIIPFNVHHGLDLGLRYERGFKIADYDSPMSQFGIRMAYRYSF
jgi:hypothetical protein